MRAPFHRWLGGMLLGILLAACAAQPADAGRFGFGFTHKTQTIVAQPGPAVVTYDTSIGASVDTNGFASLPLRVGAHRYFVNSSTGSNANDCTAAQTAATPKASIASAWGCVTGGNGDQVLVAQGTSYAEYLPNFTGKDGFSATYPTTLQSYDPADPANEAKIGHAASPNRPVLTATQANNVTGGSGATASYLAIRGFDINPGNVTDSSVPFFPNTTGMPNYILVENNIFRFTELNFDSGAAYGVRPIGNHLIVRNNSIYGAWSNTGHRQGIYLAFWNAYTFEDNVFWHNGWSPGVSRDTAIASGGLSGDTVFRHSVYAQEDSTNGIARRNLMIDGPADCGSYRGSIAFTENVGIDCPIGVGVGGGLAYNVDNPSGVALEVGYNAFIGSADQDSTHPAGLGMTSVNGVPGSSAHHNLWVRNPTPAGTNVATMGVGAAFPQPSYMDFNANIAYSWAVSGQSTSKTASGTGTTANDLPFYTNNLWDDPTSGSNTNDAGTSFPNAYTAAALYTALGYADKTALTNYVIDHPEAHVQRAARALLFAGYGMNITAPGTLALANSSFVLGTPSSTRIIGSLPGTTISGSGIPASMSFNSGARTFAYDGTGSLTTSTFTLTESAHNSTVGYSIGNAPATLSASDHSTGITLSNGNLTVATSGSGPFGIRASRSVTAGSKSYWEVHVDVFSDAMIPGIANATASFTASFWGLTATPNAAGWFTTILRYNTTTQAVNSPANWVGLAYDDTAKKLWVRDSTGWINGDPAAGTGGLSVSGIGTVYAAWQGDSGDKATFNFGGSSYNYTVPSGFGNY